MSTKVVVDVVEVESVASHPNADRLEVAIIKGWQVVVPKGEYVPGDKVVYFPPDVIVPQEWSDQFGVTKYLSNGRVRCARLRGEPSFGFVVRAESGVSVGTDMVGIYGVTKYEPPIRPTAGDAEREHPMFPPYTDVENLRNFPDVFEPGEPVSVTEKIHGCLRATTRIRMADGSLKRIKDIEVGEEVLGVDDDGLVVATPVLNTFINGQSEEWLRLSGKRRGLGRGNSEWVVVATPNHRFYLPAIGTYVSADSLKEGDEVLMVRNEIGLTPIQEQVLIGKMLGDGTLQLPGTGSAAVSFGHNNPGYTEWTVRALGSLVTQSVFETTSGYGSAMMRRTTASRWDIAALFTDWLNDDGKKCVPLSLVERITPIALAFWYMDDGSLAHTDEQEDRALFATCAFDECDHLVLVEALRRYGIHAVVFHADGYYRLRLNEEAAERLFLLIAPYVPPAMQHKLPDRYRGGPGWLPDPGHGEYKPRLRVQRIDKIEVYRPTDKENRGRYDIETGTHNFFASDVLVHNSSARVGWVDGEWMAGSMRVRRKRPEGDDLRVNTYWYPLSLAPVVRLFEDFAGTGARQIVLYGEVYGPKVQSFGYGVTNGVGFAAFDLMIDGKFVDARHFAQVVTGYGIPVVPVLTDVLGGKVPYNLDTIKALSAGPATFGGGHIREGVVVKPMTERTDPRVGRAVLKYVSDDYLLGNHSDYTER